MRENKIVSLIEKLLDVLAETDVGDEEALTALRAAQIIAPVSRAYTPKAARILTQQEFLKEYLREPA